MSETLNMRRRAAVLGALVADAASLGFHWLYDQDRIRELAPSEPEFRKPDAADFDGAAGYFAHGRKRLGDLSHYGEQARVLMRSLMECRGEFQHVAYQDQFHDFFGYGGDYVGYIDHATRETLNQMERAGGTVQETSSSHYFGAKDDQLSAISKLPPLVARFVGSSRLEEWTESAVRVTNHLDRAVDYGIVVARTIETAIVTASPSLAVDAGLQGAAQGIESELRVVSEAGEQGVVEFSKAVGLSCDLKFGVPIVLFQLGNATSFVSAIRENIWAGGDSCGRAILLGSVLGACFGVGGEIGIPEDWLRRLNRNEEIDFWLSQLIKAG